jgi:arsenical pump membrane protein
MPAVVSASSILALTVALSLSRPRVGRVRINPWSAAILGALLTVLLGLIDHRQVASCLRFLSLPILTLFSLMVITLIAEHVGLFRYLAGWIAIGAKGSGQRLFAYLFFTGTLVGTLFTNDAAVLIFTPMVVRLVDEVADETWSAKNKVPYYFAVLYVANLVGAFIISNPINIVVSSLFGIGFAEYASWMVLPAIVSILTTYGGLWLFFRRWIPKTYRIPASAPRPLHPEFARSAGVVLGFTLVGFFTEHLTGIPIAAVAFGGAAVLGYLHWRFTGGGISGVVGLLRGVAWDVIVFVTGIFLVANGLRNAGVTRYLGSFITEHAMSVAPAPIFSTGFVAATCSAVMNNHPVADMMAMVIRDMPLSQHGQHLMVFAALIGGDLGPKMLPIGSLAALLWFRILRDRGVSVSYWQYIRIGVPVTLAAILLSLLTLAAEAGLRGAG